MPTYAAVDLGATSGRVVNVSVDSERIRLDLVHRFPTAPLAGRDGGLVWPFDPLLSEVLHGLGLAAERDVLRSVAVDAWGVDYGLLDAAGQPCGAVHAYRSHRTDGVMAAVTARVGRRYIYETTGIQFLPFNTAYQLVAAQAAGELDGAAQLLMVPDLVNHRLCGSTTNEVTNASTTQLLDARTRVWSADLCERLGLPMSVLPALHGPGTILGPIGGDVAASHPGLAGVTVVAAASHDTASAVAGTPLLASGSSAYISCGTWALVGCERSAPVTTDQALAANVTNELGIGDTTRLLKNVTGLWLLEECRRAWGAGGLDLAAGELVAAASTVPGGRAVVDPDDPRLAGPGDMPELIRSVCVASSQESPETPAEVTRVIIDSLALCFRRTVRTIERIGGSRAAVVHLVGGGSMNLLLARLTASACERTVWCGPAEATVVGNALVQAIADGVVADIEHGRRLVEAALPPTVVEPEPTLDWVSLDARLESMQQGSS
jgi:rhamnulokinase